MPFKPRIIRNKNGIGALTGMTLADARPFAQAAADHCAASVPRIEEVDPNYALADVVRANNRDNIAWDRDMKALTAALVRGLSRLSRNRPWAAEHVGAPTKDCVVEFRLHRNRTVSINGVPACDLHSVMTAASLFWFDYDKERNGEGRSHEPANTLSARQRFVIEVMERNSDAPRMARIDEVARRRPLKEQLKTAKKERDDFTLMFESIWATKGLKHPGRTKSKFEYWLATVEVK